MANIKIPRKEFEKYCKITKDIEEKISMFGTPLESLSDNEVEIEIFPNRPDLLSLQGYIRSFLAFLNKKTGLKKYKINPPEKDYEVIVDKSVQDIRPYTACAIVKGLNFDDEKIKEVIGIQEKIHTTLGRNRKKIAIGIYPLEKITLPIKYEARAPNTIKFTPLESNKEMTGTQIINQHPTGKEYANLLKGKKKFPIFTDKNNEILSMPPIINSNNTGKIATNTKEIFIECSGFDFNILKKTLNILITMFSDMGGKIYQMNIKYKKTEITPDLNPEKMKINIENVNKLLGLSLSEKEIKKLLWRMGYDYYKQEVSIPPWRTDILHEVDLIEDIAIAYGYDKLIPEIPDISTIGEEDKNAVMKRKISDILTGLNIIENSTYHLLTKEEMKKLRRKVEIEVEKSKTDYKVLRQDLIPSTLRVLSENTNADYPQRIFEIGKVFEKDGNVETKIKEKDKLSIAIVPGNYTEIRQILEYLARMLSLEIKFEKTINNLFIEGRTAKILSGDKEIGILGEVSPNTLKSYHLKLPLALLEIDLDAILD